MKWIYKIPILGTTICYLLIALMKILIPILYKAGRCERIRVGSSTIWAPKNRKQIILEGIECLRTRDLAMYSRLASKRLLFFYTNRKVENSGRYTYGLEEQYLKWGAEGAAAFFVQSILFFQVSSSINRSRLNKDELTAYKLVLQKVIEWMREHSFQPKLIGAFGMAAKKWEAQRIFRII